MLYSLQYHKRFQVRFLKIMQKKNNNKKKSTISYWRLRELKDIFFLRCGVFSISFLFL